MPIANVCQQHKSTFGVHYRTRSPGELGLRVAGFPGHWVAGSQNVTQFHVWCVRGVQFCLDFGVVDAGVSLDDHGALVVARRLLQPRLERVAVPVQLGTALLHLLAARVAVVLQQHAHRHWLAAFGMNEVNARRARLVLGWVTVSGRVFHLGM